MKKDIKKALLSIEKTVAILRDQLDNASSVMDEKEKEKEKAQKKSSNLRRNALIMRYVSKLMAGGIPKKEACLICAGKMKIEPSFVNDIFEINENDQRYIDQRVNYLIVHKLHENGFPANKIAKICNFSEKYIYKVLKKVVKYRCD